MHWKFRWIALTLVCVILAGGLVAAVRAASPSAPQVSSVIIPPGSPILIAMATCNAFPTFQDHIDAMQMALDDFGPIKGFALLRNNFLNLCDEASGASSASTIVANPQIVGVIGPIYSTSTVGAAPVFESAGLVMISPSNTRPDLPDFGPNIFNRTTVFDPYADGWLTSINGLPSALNWRADFQSTYGREPDVFAVLAYDATMILLQRIQQVSSVDGGGNLVIDRSALATAVRNTINYPGASGPVTFDFQGNRVDTLRYAVTDDPFASPTLNPRWSWINEDPAYWSLTANPGFLRIITQQANNNRLLQDPPTGDFELRTRLLFEPSENYQIAALYVFLDTDNYLQLGRAFCDAPPPNCVGNGIYFDHVEGGNLIGGNYATSIAVPDEAYLRLVKSGDTFTGYVSTNGTQWSEIGAHTIGFSSYKIGLRANNQGQPAAEIPADFDYFVLTSQASLIYLPIILR